MPGIDLSSLNGQELRRLLKVAHSRRDGLFADRLEWEIASRAAASGEHAAGPFAYLPEDDPEEPFFRSIALDDEPLVIEREAEEPASARGILMMACLGVVAGFALSGPAFWGLERMQRPPALEKVEPHPTRAMAARSAPARSAPVRAARAAPPPAPVAPGADQVVAVLAPGPFPPSPKPVVPQAVTIVAEAAPTAPLEAAIPAAEAPVEVAEEEAPEKPVVAEAKAPVEKAVEKKAAATKKEPAAPVKEAALKKEPVAKTERAPQPPPPMVRLAKAETTARTPAPQRDACARSTPADRLVCSDLSLRLIDLELKNAYARALNARADPDVVGAGQSAWRRARDEVSDPDRLARLYTQRIRELEAAAAAARASRPAG
jgi:hypothetical protein